MNGLNISGNHWKTLQEDSFMKKLNWKLKNLICDQWWKTKGTQGHFTIDRRIIALDTMPFESRYENSKEEKSRKFWNENMENKLLKKGTFGNVMLGSWMNQTHQTLYQKNLKNLLRKPSTLTNHFANQTGTYGPVMLRSCYELLFISRLSKIESSTNKFRS